MADSWHTYPSIYNLGHRYLEDLLLDPVTVEEKVDGSQFSFGRFTSLGLDSDVETLRAKSRSKDLDIAYPEKMFAHAVDTVKMLGSDLHEGWTYRGEYLQKPKHNALHYDRVPAEHVILFDINTGHEQYLSYEDKAAEAKRLGLEVVPLIYSGVITSLDQFRGMLDRVSILGGQNIEGVVVKNYSRFGLDKKALLGKFVSESFKEVHRKEWKSANPTNGDILQILVGSYKSPARWQKAVQHLREAGELTDSPADIGKLIQEAQADIAKECSEEISQALLRYFMPKVQRGAIGGLPEWYKQKLLEAQFVPQS